jgi:TRAP-type uncharacterized transport system substrate-binding protein
MQMNQALKFLLLAAAVLLTACGSRPSELKLVAPSSDLDLEIAQNLAVLLNQGSDFRLDITAEQRSGEEALDMLLSGDADIALVSNFLPYREGITTVMPMYPSVLHIAYRDGRDASSGYTLLNQARIYAGREGSASRLMLERIVTRMHLPADAYSYIERSGNARSTDPDIAVIFAPISPQRADEFIGYQLFSFGTPAEIGTGSIIDAAALLNPPLRPFIIPASTYGAANLGPIVTVAVDKVLVATSDLDASAVYDLINEIRRLRPALSATRPGLFDQLGDSFDVSRSTFVLHAGTQDFLQRAEPTIYERYSGVAEVIVTLLIALASATLAGFRILKMRRKNRIDRFYSAAIEIRDSVSPSSNGEDRARAVEKIRELQNTAFDQLVDEKLSADESFRIFITLSNDVLRQLR